MKPYTHSERIGILVIAGIALTVTATGLLTSRCNRGSNYTPAPIADTIPTVQSDTAGGNSADSIFITMEKPRSGCQEKKESKRKETPQKIQKPQVRDILNETVPQE